LRRSLFLVPLVLFLVLVGYFVLALRPDRDPSELPSAMIDKPAPGFDLAALDGGARLATATFAGQVALLNFFASWCVPCRVEHPLLMRMTAEEKIPLYGIDYKDRPEDAKRFLAQLGDPFKRVGLDADGRLGIDFGVYGVPETYVVDKSGRIRYRQVGPLTSETLEGTILPMIKKLGAS